MTRTIPVYGDHVQDLDFRPVPHSTIAPNSQQIGFLFCSLVLPFYSYLCATIENISWNTVVREIFLLKFCYVLMCSLLNSRRSPQARIEFWCNAWKMRFGSIGTFEGCLDYLFFLLDFWVLFAGRSITLVESITYFAII